MQSIEEISLSEIISSISTYSTQKIIDGGSGQGNTLKSVTCATIALFRKLDLAMVVIAGCVPGKSWVNPAERIMN